MSEQDRPQTSPEPEPAAWQSYLPVAAGLVVIAASLIYAVGHSPAIRSHDLIIWPALLISFIIISLLPNRTNISWLGYPHATLMVAWLTTGLIDALALTILGAIVVGLIYLLWGTRLGLLPISRLQIARLAGGRIAISGTALFVAALIYGGLGQRLPLGTLTGYTASRLLLAYVASLVTAHVLAALLFQHSLIQATKALWSPGRRGLFILELALPVAVISFAVVVFSLGDFVFLAILALGTAEVVSTRLASRANDNLSERVEELSLLNTIGETISSSLVMDDLLERVYEQVKAITGAPAFYIALYDDVRHQFDYPLVMIDGRRSDAPGPVEETCVATFVARSRVVLHIADRDQLRLLGITPSELENRYPYVCALPLLTGSDIPGVMVVLENRAANRLNKTSINLLRAVAGQAALAIHNASLYAQSLETARYLSLINTSVQSVVTNLDRERAAEMICAAAQTIAGANGAALFLYSRQTQRIELAYSTGLSPEQTAALAEMPHVTRLPGPEPCVIALDEPTDDGQALREFAEHADIPGLIDATLRSVSTLVGYLTLVYDAPHASTPAEINLLETLASQVSTALENTELFQSLENYAFEMAQLAHLSRVSTANLDIHAVMSSVAQILCQMMSMSRTSIVLIDASGALRSITAETAAAAQAIIRRDDSATKFPELAALFQAETLLPRAYQIDDSNLSPELHQLMAQAGETTVAIVPLVMNDKTAGAIVLGSRVRRDLSEREWQLVEMAANQTASHLQNAQLYTATNEALRLRMDQLALIENIARQISSALDFQQIVSHLLDATVRVTQADYVSLILRTANPQSQVVYETRRDGVIEYTTHAISDQLGIFGQVMRSGKPVLTGDNQASGVYVAPPNQKTFRSSAVVPLIRDNQVIGTLNVESESPGFFHEEQIGFLSSLADHAVISIGNARMVDEQQYQVQSLASLQSLALRLSSAMDPHAVADVILETTLAMFKGREAALFLYDDRSGDLTALTALRADGSRPPTTPSLLEITTDAAQSGEVQIVQQVGEAGTALTSSISVPLKRGNRVREVLAIGFADARAFAERDLESLALLASQSAGHLENAVLHEQMRAILKSTREGILLFDGKNRLVEANPAARQIWGDQWESAIARAAAEIPPLAETAADAINRQQVEQTNERGAIYVEEVGLPVTDSQNRAVGWLLILRDITEEKKLADYRDEISHMVVHDLRGPLSSIMSSLNLALEELPQTETNDFVRETLYLSTDSANSLMVLVESMLDVARLQAQAMVLAIQPTNAAWLVERATQALAATIRQVEIRLKVNVPDDLPPLAVDGDMIRRVMINLLDNAIHFTPLSGEILIDAAPYREPGWLLFRLADSGPGVPPEDRERVFEKFKQARSRSELKRARGTGLGLTFCKLAVEAHGGCIWIEPESPLSGACFAFTLPIAAPQDELSSEKL